MKKIIITSFICLFAFLTILGCSNKKTSMTDAEKFKKEYEALNGQKNTSDKEHRTLDISSDNPFVYINTKQLIEKIENKETFYVYFGSAYCPWCRSVIETFIDKAKEKKIDKVYYLDIWDGDHVEILRDKYELDENNKPKLVASGGVGYDKLLEYFDKVLSDYTLTDEDGNSIQVGEKRIFAPNFIHVERGKATKITDGISDKQKDAREKLTDEILKDEKKAFDDFFKQDNACDLESKC